MADNNYVENRDILQVSDLGEEVLVPIDIATRYNVGSWSELERKYLVAKNIFGVSGQFTVTPDVTTGTGTSTDFTFNFIKVGSKAILSFFSEVLEIPVGEQILKIQIDLTGTSAEPAANFIGPYSFTGSINQYDVNLGTASILLANAAVLSVNGTKKILVVLGTDALVSGSNYQASIGGTITITI